MRGPAERLPCLSEVEEEYKVERLRVCESQLAVVGRCDWMRLNAMLMRPQYLLIVLVVVAVAEEARGDASGRNPFARIHLSFAAARTPAATDTGHHEKVWIHRPTALLAQASAQRARCGLIRILLYSLLFLINNDKFLI